MVTTDYGGRQGQTSTSNDIDDIFDYSAGGIDDVFNDDFQHTSKDISVDAASKKSGGANLGLDEEVEVTRKPRAPRVKLDEHRYIN